MTVALTKVNTISDSVDKISQIDTIFNTDELKLRNAPERRVQNKSVKSIELIITEMPENNNESSVQYIQVLKPTKKNVQSRSNP